MKKISTICICALLGVQIAFAQSFRGNIILSSQEEVNAFAYTEVIGDVTIEEMSSGDITDLRPLAQLERLEGGLFIRNNEAITHLNSFAQLETLQGTLEIIGNTNLSDLNGLSGIYSVGDGDIIIQNNHNITSLRAFNNIESIEGKLNIHWNTGLEGIDGFIHLDTVGGLEISANLNMTNLNGFSNLRYVQGNLILRDNNLRDLTGLANLFGIQDFFLKKSKINSLDGLSSLAEVGGNVYIYENPNLQNIEALSRSISGTVNYVEVGSNPVLESLTGLEGLESVKGLLKIVDNKSLKNLDALSGVSAITFDMEITDNTALEDACGIWPLLFSNSIGGNTTIANNTRGTNSIEEIINACEELFIYEGDLVLQSQEAIDSFRYAEVTGDLIIQENTPGDIVNLDGLESLDRVGGSVSVVNNTALSDIFMLGTLDQGSYNFDPNFPMPQSIGGDLILDRNPLITEETIDEAIGYFICWGIANNLKIRNTTSEDFVTYNLETLGEDGCRRPRPDNSFLNRGGGSSKIAIANVPNEEPPMVYPTVSNGHQITLVGKDITKGQLYSIYTMAGQHLVTQEVTNDAVQVITFNKQLVAGMYILQVHVTDTMLAIRFIVE